MRQPSVRNGDAGTMSSYAWEHLGRRDGEFHVNHQTATFLTILYNPSLLLFPHCQDRRIASSVCNATGVLWRPRELCVVKGYMAENCSRDPWTCCSPRDFRLGSHTSPPWALRCPTNTNSIDQQAPGFYFSPQRLRSVSWGDASIPLRGFGMDEGLAAMRLRRATPSSMWSPFAFSADNKCEGGSWFPAISFLVRSSSVPETGGPISVVECLFCCGRQHSLTDAEPGDHQRNYRCLKSRTVQRLSNP